VCDSILETPICCGFYLLLRFVQVAYGNADVLDPSFTYGVTWQPEEPELAPAVKLTAADAYVSKSLPPAPGGCIWYKVISTQLHYMFKEAVDVLSQLRHACLDLSTCSRRCAAL
jgi:hypothetical protein